RHRFVRQGAAARDAVRALALGGACGAVAEALRRLSLFRLPPQALSASGEPYRAAAQIRAYLLAASSRSTAPSAAEPRNVRSVATKTKPSGLCATSRTRSPSSASSPTRGSACDG